MSKVTLRDRVLVVGETPLEGHEIIKELGRGANGIVYLSRNSLLKREEAIKVWMSLRAGDKRDKAKQGLSEAAKLAAAGGNCAVQIYSARMLEGRVLASMEYVDGSTMASYCAAHTGLHSSCSVASMCLDAIVETTKRNLFHGDPHASNVLIYQDKKLGKGSEMRLKLCDFGTSVFSGRVFSKQRHWNVVRETVVSITKHLPGADEHAKKLSEWEKGLETLIENAEKGAGGFSDHDIARLRTAALRDYLGCWSDLYAG